jgi:hypothetical protein
LAKEDFSDMVAEHAAKQKVNHYFYQCLLIAKCIHFSKLRKTEQEKETTTTNGH